MVDKKVVGTQIEVRASVLRSEPECRRRYGSNWRTKLIRGRVVSSDVRRVRNNNRRTTFITGEFYFEGQAALVKEVIARHVTVYVSPWESDSSETKENEEEEEEEDQSEDDFVPDVSSSSDSSASLLPRNDARPGFKGRRDARLAAGMSTYEASCEEVLSDAVSVTCSEDAQEDDPVHFDDVGEWLYTGEEVCEVNDEKWYKDDCHIPVNGVVPPKAWSVRNSLGEVLTANCDKVSKRYSRLQVFMMMMPPKALRDMLNNTNEQSQIVELKELTKR